MKTESEVTVIKFLEQRTTVPVPSILDYEVDAEKSVLDGCEWILMFKISGVVVTPIIRSISMSDRKKLITQMLENVVVPMQQFKFPMIGAFKEGMKPGPICFDGPPIGPFEKWSDFVGASVEWGIRHISDSPFLVRYRPWIPALRLFLDGYLTEFKKKEITTEYPLCHTDLNGSNVLVDLERMQITGILDWEHARAAPFLDEWNHLSGAWGTNDAETEESEEWLIRELKRFGIEMPQDIQTHNDIKEVMENTLNICFFCSTWWSEGTPRMALNEGLTTSIAQFAPQLKKALTKVGCWIDLEQKEGTGQEHDGDHDDVYTHE